MDIDGLIKELSAKSEIEPDSHDGSYELVRETVSAYASLSDDELNKLTYRDLNLLYFMAVGTWKINVEKKKNRVFDSYLPVEEKQRLSALLDLVWDRACRDEYENSEGNRPSIGMFGTGFMSFENKMSDSDACSFIRMCVDITEFNSDEVESIYSRVEETFKSIIKGMKAASASVILHCLMPRIFPILNSNMGNQNIFVALGIKLDKCNELITYASNCRAIMKFRDEHFSFKNYRVFDLMAHDLDKFDDREYFPSLSEYNPGISSEQYVQMLKDEGFISKKTLDTVYYLYLMGGEASCKQLASAYGNVFAHYNANGRSLAEKVYRATGCPLYDNSYWPILFIGRDTDIGEEGNFVWRLRPPLKEAIACLDEEGFFEELVMKSVNVLDKNLILYGPPGTGKTYSTAIYAVAICDGVDVKSLTDYDSVMKRYNQLKTEGRIAFTTFHQSYGYEEFIEGIRPIVDGDSNDISYAVKDGVFKRFCEVARTPAYKNIDPDSSLLNLLPRKDESAGKPYVFVIDEINRGNVAKIFGELITLIEDTKREGMNEAVSTILPYSGDTFSVPSNVYILGTMNTADRSIALMDTALRRRFNFIEMLPDSNVLKGIVVTSDGQSLDVAKMLEIINERIVCLYDREHTIGHAFFTKLRKEPTVEKLAEVFRKSLIPLLQEYFYEDYNKIQLVLGDNGKSDEKTKFILNTKVDSSVFNSGNFDFDLPEYNYVINGDALYDIRSYKGISTKL